MWLDERACFSREAFNESSGRQFVTSEFCNSLIAMKLNWHSAELEAFYSLGRILLCMNIRLILFCMLLIYAL